MNNKNDMTEDDVVIAVAEWLEAKGFNMLRPPCLGRMKGDDIAALSPDGVQVYVECKGSISKAGGQLADWNNSAMAVFGAIVETEHKRPNHRHAIAVPRTESYMRTLQPLRNFFVKQGVTLLWVEKTGNIIVDGAPNNSLEIPQENRLPRKLRF